MEELSSPPTPSPSSGTRDALAAAGWALAYLLVAASIQFLVVAVPYDADTAYHAAVGRLIGEHGILRAFPWTPFSWLADHYADKELFFHLLFVPFDRFGWITASKLVGTLCGGGALFALYWVLRSCRVRWAGLWALVPLITSDVFLFRFALVRPHLLSIGLAFLVLWSATGGRLLLLGLFSTLYPWTYVAWQMPLALVVLSESAQVLSGRRFRWRSLGAAVAGAALGVAVHPNGLNLIRFNWTVIVDILFRTAWSGREGIELGLEFAPFLAKHWLQWLLGSVLMALSATALAWRDRKEAPENLAFALAALAYGVLTLRTARFAEYMIPFSVAAFALSTRRASWRFLPWATFALLALYTAKPASETLGELGRRIEYIPPALAAQLQQEIPPGSQVFTTDWGHTGTLMLALPDRKFVVALDPTLFYLKDRELYRLWYDLPRKAPPNAPDLIRRAFGARYVVSFFDDRWVPFYERFVFQPGVRTLLNSDAWMVFDLGPGGAGAR